ncbi:type II toxin-antitoxin system RatA family toxin [Kaistia dalseonensis]|uniref:Coenzyme Q-binding protein COQ10 n=1 Tax=Kaistia dalseonensis TaxID=410840 RepID=A0ABU0H310_9HYPH|nr:type II toxin-antitoxin system RatA family toxin [Kaistia dalseonensis]MCX5494109.1 type II toxin-antitoxin system RatA family toxin [Kaistia dalseonensis]MDQ0436688.1 coenzyme Q-binding protein COQ10 [Kaistia dalseonensis]
MPSFKTERRVAHSADEMFALVADVEQYPKFVPLCERLIVRGRQQDAAREVLVADMTVAYKIVRETFTTKVVLDRLGSTIRADYLDGPFKHLENIWSFAAIDAEHSVIRFSIDYEFRSRTLSTLMGAVFDKAFRKFADAFEKRADEIYGKAALPSA